MSARLLSALRGELYNKGGYDKEDLLRICVLHDIPNVSPESTRGSLLRKMVDIETYKDNNRKELDSLRERDLQFCSRKDEVTGKLEGIEEDYAKESIDESDYVFILKAKQNLIALRNSTLIVGISTVQKITDKQWKIDIFCAYKSLGPVLLGHIKSTAFINKVDSVILEAIDDRAANFWKRNDFEKYGITEEGYTMMKFVLQKDKTSRELKISENKYNILLKASKGKNKSNGGLNKPGIVKFLQESGEKFSSKLTRNQLEKILKEKLNSVVIKNNRRSKKGSRRRSNRLKKNKQSTSH
jgi:hypothetical protein